MTLSNLASSLLPHWLTWLYGCMFYSQFFLNTLELNMTTQEEYAQDLIDTDVLEVINSMDQEQIAGTIRAMYWANERGDMISVNIFAKSLSNALFEKAMDITEKKFQENNVYQGPFDEMYDMGHSHGDFA
jgi:hypothetical protein